MDAGQDGLAQVLFMRLRDGGWSIGGGSGPWRPPTDAYETDEQVVIKVEVAGMREEDFLIELMDRRLVISGVRRDPGGKRSYQNMEIRYGAFLTELQLGWTVDPDAVDAVYEHGFLYVRLPKAPRRVPVRIVPADER
ncbi:MAG: Hsp20/alpha crystallin family protein [Anaerolineae bacterium]|nr:Hsp20/alpha crystallin family protein [Anaerolineae bacterium]